MSTEELLKDRYKVIALWPNTDYKVGEIISDTAKIVAEKFFDPYPHLFRKLPFWEHREEKDLPQYIKWKSGKIDKVSSWDVNYDNEGEAVFTIGEYSYYADDGISPSTLEEYNQYIKSKQ